MSRIVAQCDSVGEYERLYIYIKGAPVVDWLDRGLAVREFMVSISGRGV